VIKDARCSECPLQHCSSPLGFENNGSEVLFLGDGLGKQDEELRTPFVDNSGVTLIRELERLNKNRKSVDWGTLIACRWPNDNPKEFLAKLKTRNRKRISKGKVPFLSPIDACRPHIREELQRYRTIVPLGNYPTKALLPGNPRFEDVRGGPTIVRGVKILPTYHPTALRGRHHLKEVLRSDLAKAFRHHDEKLNWTDAQVLYDPTVEEATTFFQHVIEKKLPLAYDVETDDIESLTAGLRCIGIGTESHVLLISFLSIDGETRTYSPEEERDIKSLLCEILTTKSVLKIGHNAGYFDRIVVEQHLGVTPEPLLDTLLLHKLAASEHRHSLGFIGSVLTDVPSWKADHSGVLAKTDRELHEYCATDVVVTARIATQLQTQAKKRSQLHLYPFDAQLQDLCAGMHRMGMRIDEKKRMAHEIAETEKAAKWLMIVRDHQPFLNPNSHVQLRDLLFDEWALPPHDYTTSGEPSTDAATLRSLMGNPLVDDEKKEFINALRFYRRSEKLLSTYLRKLAPGAGVVQDEYVYPDYNCHGTVTGRFSSSNPNFQNFPFKLRDMFIPPKGCVFIGADYDQLELRFASALAGAAHYLNAFEENKIDPHNLTGELMFGMSFWTTDGAPATRIGKGTGAFKDMRNLAKTICFASLYGAGVPKVHEIISRGEDDDGNLLYAHIKERQVRALHTRWLRRAPEFKAWWNAATDFCRKKHYIDEVVRQRRRYCDPHDRNAIINYGVQSGSFAIVAAAMLDLIHNHIPFDFVQKTGLVNQLHDAVLLSVPESQAEELKSVVTEVLESRVSGLPVTFTAEAQIGENWKDV